MKLIKPHYEIWIQKLGIDGIYKQIERAGRVCYKSENNITEDSAKAFVDRLIASKHYSVLEHGTVYLKVPFEVFCDLDKSITYKPWNSFTLTQEYPDDVLLTTNYRWIVENNMEEWLQYMCKPTEYHERRITVHFTLSRSIAQEFTRHRMFSFSMESQRYCNYVKDKFNNEVTFIIPNWLGLRAGHYTYNYPEGFTLDEQKWSSESQYNTFLISLARSEHAYFELISEGWKPQQAREVLHNACKTELVMTGFVSQWKDFFRQRDDSKAHPQAQELAKPLHQEFITRGYYEEG